MGIDNLNSYYDPGLKQDRLQQLASHPHFHFIKGSVENLELLEHLFNTYHFHTVIHLAAQAGVRYSLTHPHIYIQSNLVGFANILECCRNHQITHLLYASSSSVYGNNRKIPFSVHDPVDHPVSLYAATKKANELMAYTYSHLYGIPATGLRFFTVYGPWGRPDMALFSFTNAMLKKEPIDIFNYGNMKRDFTYIDDCIESIFRLMAKGPPTQSPPYKIYNIGNHQPVNLLDFIQILEKKLGTTAIKRFLPMQGGDVLETYADIEDLEKEINYKPGTSIEEGSGKFIDWYKDYYRKKQ